MKKGSSKLILGLLLCFFIRNNIIEIQIGMGIIGVLCFIIVFKSMGSCFRTKKTHTDYDEYM